PGPHHRGAVGRAPRRRRSARAARGRAAAEVGRVVRAGETRAPREGNAMSDVRVLTLHKFIELGYRRAMTIVKWGAWIERAANSNRSLATRSVAGRERAHCHRVSERFPSVCAELEWARALRPANL